MEQKNETTPEIYFPKTEDQTGVLRLLGIIGGMVLLVFILLAIFTKKEEVVDNPYIKNQIDSLARVNKALQDKQNEMDINSRKYEDALLDLDFKVQTINQKKSIIREYYHEKIIQPAQYTPQQIDSFFKNRYNY